MTAPGSRVDDGAARLSSTGPLPRVLPPVVLLSTYPPMGGHAGKPSRLDVKLAIEAAIAGSAKRVGLADAEQAASA